MKSLNSKAIAEIVSYIREGISVYAGKGDNRRVLIKPGLKLIHVGTKGKPGSGLCYTVEKVLEGEDDLLIKCVRAGNVAITLTTQDLKEFERA